MPRKKLAPVGPVHYYSAVCTRGPNNGQEWVVWSHKRIWILPTEKEPISWEGAGRYVWWPTHPHELRYKRPATPDEIAEEQKGWANDA